jgi:hypothetical protein
VKINRVVLNYYESGRRQIPLSVAAALARLYGTSVESLLAGDEVVGAGVDVSGLLFRAAPHQLGDRAQAGLRLFEQRVADYVELAREMGAALPGAGRSPLTSARTSSAKEAAWAARQLRRCSAVGLLALLSAAALTPAAITGGGVLATELAGVAGNIGGGLLSGVIDRAIARLHDGKAAPLESGAVRDALETELLAALQQGASAAQNLSVALTDLLMRIDGFGAAVEAVGADLRGHLQSCCRELAAQQGEVLGRLGAIDAGQLRQERQLRHQVRLIEEMADRLRLFTRLLAEWPAAAGPATASSSGLPPAVIHLAAAGAGPVPVALSALTGERDLLTRLGAVRGLPRVSQLVAGSRTATLALVWPASRPGSGSPCETLHSILGENAAPMDSWRMFRLFTGLAGLCGTLAALHDGAELASNRERDRFNLPERIDEPESLGEEIVHLPLYIIRAVQRDGRVRYLAYSQAQAEADPDVTALCEATPEIVSLLNTEERVAGSGSEPARARQWLESRNLAGHPLARLDTGMWRATLPGSSYDPGGPLPISKLGSFVVLASDFFQVWCDEEQVRRRALLERVDAWLSPRTRPDRTAAEELIAQIARQLELGELNVSALRHLATRAGKTGLAAQLKSLQGS